MLYEPVDDESFMADGHYDNAQFKSDGHYMVRLKNKHGFVQLMEMFIRPFVFKDVAPVNKSETDAYMDVHVDEEDA